MKLFKFDRIVLVVPIFTVCLFLVGIMSLVFSYRGTSERVTEKEVECDTVNWSLIENEDFEIDMEKMDIALIKRSFNDGDEVTLIELTDGEQKYFVCSRSTHQRFVNEFRKLKESRKEGGN